MQKLVLGLVVLGACGGSSSTPIDAAIDTAVEVEIDAPVKGAAHHYVIDHVTLPAPGATFGVDFDGDGDVDNAFADFSNRFTIGTPDQLALLTNKSIDVGAPNLLLELTADDLAASGYSTFATLVGHNPVPPACNGSGDTICRHQLDGHAMFTADASDGHDLIGTISAGVYVGTGGHATLPISVSGGVIAEIPLIGARATLVGISETGIADGILAGGFTDAYLQQTLFPAMRDALNPIIASNCNDRTNPPNCGCPADSYAKSSLNWDLSPKNCVIEVSDLVYTFSGMHPDVVLENQPAYSLAVRFTAVRATFTR